uniref:Uncharacterized protein n=1 Tax=Spironucleus salmonicida TaxID=348837 RepID=V6LF64_9EUKA|eukprot:EST42326.1 Hypothetical protein SS50377_18113 [Spironucleus salmonicida]
MMIVLQFSCFNSSSSVEYNYISASVIFTAYPQQIKSEICQYLEGKIAIPTLAFGKITFVASQIVFSSDERLVLHLECPAAPCIEECKPPIDIPKCQSCKNARQAACKEAATASISQITFDFHTERMLMQFTPSIYQILSFDSGNCYAQYTLLYSQEKLVFSGVPFLCILELSDKVKGLMASKTCKDPIDGIPQDCPWVQLLLNGDAISIQPYYEVNLLGMGQIDVECDKVLASDQLKCRNFMKVINSNQESFVEFQLAVAVERNIGKMKTIDMPINTAIYYKGSAQIEEVLTVLDCFKDVTVLMYEDHIEIQLVLNQAPIQCPKKDFDRVEIEIYGSTDGYYTLQNSNIIIDEKTSKIFMNSSNAGNQTEYENNLTIALRGQRKNQQMILLFIQDNQIMLQQEFKVNDNQESYRNAILIVLDEQICIQATQLAWSPAKSGTIILQIQVEFYNLVWQQQIQQSREPYCYKLNHNDANNIYHLISQESNDITITIDNESIPMSRYVSYLTPRILWKQGLIIFLGNLMFTILICIIHLTRLHKIKIK